MDASKVLAVADEIEAAETEAMRDFAPRDGVDPIGAAYAAGMVDAIDGGWAKQLRAACGPDAASDASATWPTCSTWRRSKSRKRASR